MRPSAILTRRSTDDAGAAVEQLLAAWRPVLDAMRTNVFLAAPDLTLVYMNPMARDTMRRIEPDVRAAFGVGVDEMVGGSIHRFHRDPERVERVIDHGAGLPHEASFAFGSVILQTRIAPVRVGGAVVAYVVSWDEVSRIRRATEGIGTIAEHLTSVAASLEQLRGSVGVVATSAADANGVATETRSLVADSATTVHSLGEEATRIRESVGAITSVAAQTNLLALNATIEAARAGEAGKGFAVVANEVKDLARFTAETAESIEDQVETIGRVVDQVVEAMTAISARIETIVEAQSTVTTASEEQAVVAAEIAERMARTVSLNDDLRHALD